MALAGFAQFGPTATLADVAREFGQLADGDSIAEQAGLPGSVLGAGLAVVRLSALGALVLAGVADRIGRRTAVLRWAAVGLAATGAAALAPGYWWFVLAAALARPMLTATDTLGEVLAAELTDTRDRARALALTAAAYGVGSGAVALLRALAGDRVGFRGVLGLSAAMMVTLVLVARAVEEPDRFRTAGGAVPVVGAVHGAYRVPLALLAGVVFAAGLVVGPGNTFLFLYAENVLGLGTGFTAALVVVAGGAGLVGLLAGRALSDRVGRRPTMAAGLVALATSVLVAYAGPPAALAGGYLVAVLAGSVYAVPALALANESFPTRVRASVAGWLVVAGVLGGAAGLLVAGAAADHFGSFGWAMAIVCLPAAAAALLTVGLRETRGLELEESAPDRGTAAP
jgi:MFS family permease